MRKAVFLLPMLALTAACGAIPQAQAPQRAAVNRPAAATMAARPENRVCLSGLGASRASFTPLPDQYYGAGCSAVNAVRLASLRSDSASLGLTNLGPVTCPLAETFAAWARFGADRSAQQILGSALVRIETMGSYNCRNVAGSERRSAHATANAIDVSGFVLADGRRITVSGDWHSASPRVRQFLTTVQGSACKRFGTVLGPAYNQAHHDHLHLELSGKAFCR
ncbi:extensin family protein [Novosphingobium sp. B 225]|uniref:extensin family protein n=1 Tax=Novosphingobium sp. B 225 TaxID=1961849 RepID=UPI000B4B2F13|nr:extensin family protein [Novosphingobium sp. B 225]